METNYGVMDEFKIDHLDADEEIEMQQVGWAERVVKRDTGNVTINEMSFKFIRSITHPDRDEKEMQKATPHEVTLWFDSKSAAKIRIHMEMLEKGGFPVGEWDKNKKEEGLTPSFMVPRALKFCAVKKVRFVGKIVKIAADEEKGKKGGTFLNLVKVLRDAPDGTRYDDAIPNEITSDEIKLAWQIQIAKGSQQPYNQTSGGAAPAGSTPFG